MIARSGVIMFDNDIFEKWLDTKSQEIVEKIARSHAPCVGIGLEARLRRISDTV